MLYWNQWNRIRYTLYVPFYDLIAKWFTKYRRRSIELLDIQAGQSVLIIGGGTGLDLEWLPDDINITATDLTPAMVHRLRWRARKWHKQVEARVMDGQDLSFENNQFDGLILHLILAVIPDPVKCLLEAERVLKPGGKIVVLDKFIPRDQKETLGRRLMNSFTRLIATSINRRFEDILSHTSLQVTYDVAVGWKGNLRIIRLIKPNKLV